MKVLRPSKNVQTSGFSSTHKGYDYDDVPVKAYYASFDGEVKTVINTWNKSWIANKPSDPFYPGDGKPPRALRTDDYGNFLKILGDNGLTQLAAHFPKDGIVVRVGQRVKRGQVIGYAPGTDNDTGNSTGGHTHTEYRLSNGVTTSVEFTDDYPTVVQEPNMPDMFKMPSGKEVDLSNRESNIALAKVFDEVMNQNLWIKRVDAQQILKEEREQLINEKNNAIQELANKMAKERDDAVKQAYKDGQASVPTPPANDGDETPKIDMDKLELNGFVIETTNGVKKTIANYKPKA